MYIPYKNKQANPSNPTPVDTIDCHDVQADVLATDISENTKITGLKQLKTETKVPTKAINALNEQLGNAQASASDALHRIIAVENDVANIKRDATDGTSQYVYGNVSMARQTFAKAQHIYGMVIVPRTGDQTRDQWVRIDENFNVVEFNELHGTWAEMYACAEVGGNYLQIPVTWVKTEVLQDGPYAGCMCWWTADGEVDDFHIHPAFLSFDGLAYPLRIGFYFVGSSASIAQQSLNASSPFETLAHDTLFLREATYANAYNKTGWHAYSIYTHSLVQRLILTELGNADLRRASDDIIPKQYNYTAPYVEKYSWRGLKDLIASDMSSIDSEHCTGIHLFGLATANGTYHLLSNTGKREIIDTKVPCINKNAYINRPLLGKGRFYDFGDVFLASNEDAETSSGSTTPFHGNNYKAETGTNFLYQTSNQELVDNAHFYLQSPYKSGGQGLFTIRARLNSNSTTPSTRWRPCRHVRD